MPRTSAGYDFLVRSRDVRDDRWLEHARASVSVFLGALQAAAPVSSAQWRKGEIPQEKAVAFGERWRNIARMLLADRSAMAELELPAQFAGDLGAYAAHPALTDMAATFGLHLVDAAEREQNLFVPLSVERIRLVAQVPASFISRVELKGTRSRFAAFDVSLHTPDGSPIATFEGFSLRGVKPDAVSHQAPAQRERSLTDALLACGIRGEDSHELFARVLSSASRGIMVSSIELSQIRQAMTDALPKVTIRKPGASGEAAGSASLNPVERTIAEVWRELLGVEEIGTEDDFFALGGHSLAAVRLFARIRKQYAVDLPLATLFQAPTLGALAAVVAHAGGLDTAQPAAEPEKPASNVISLVTRSWSPLVAICRGRADRVPLFCVHGAGGNVLNFKVISDRLGQEQPFYGLQAQGVDGRLAPLNSDRGNGDAVCRGRPLRHSPGPVPPGRLFRRRRDRTGDGAATQEGWRRSGASGDDRHACTHCGQAQGVPLQEALVDAAMVVGSSHWTGQAAAAGASRTMRLTHWPWSGLPAASPCRPSWWSSTSFAASWPLRSATNPRPSMDPWRCSRRPRPTPNTWAPATRWVGTSTSAAPSASPGSRARISR